MKKLLLSSLAVAALSLASLSASAASLAPSAFTVTVALTPTCQIVNTTPQTIAFGTYTALTNLAKTASLTFKLKCTRGLVISVPTLAFDNEVSPGVANGVVAGLNYSLSYTNTTANNTAGTEAVAAGPVLGTPATFEYNVKGDMVGGQAGNETIATASSTDNRTITVTY